MANEATVILASPGQAPPGCKMSSNVPERLGCGAWSRKRRPNRSSAKHKQTVLVGGPEGGSRESFGKAAEPSQQGPWLCDSLSCCQKNPS